MIRIPAKYKYIKQYDTSQRFKSSSSDIRNSFLDYFSSIHGHKQVKSSSVVPLCDPTVPFVNAGMNQFKGIFLGRSTAPFPRVVNSQKCVRVGGKHNDLEVVGTDGNHHTFFEMLGNWSFGDYYKTEACQMAWELLTGPLRLNPHSLVVTYFGGEKELHLHEDKETRDIWRKIGVQASRIQPLGMSENFWEMGATGPCGPCTEIHHVNTDGTLTEIWNIVFIQYNRESDGSIAALPKRHVDTGMGLERMAALLQGASSNYDTDLFTPIIKAIEKKSGSAPAYGGKFGRTAVADSAYRCLADHARMLSVCLADGMFPASSLNLKQVMRKSFKISEEVFQTKSGMLSELYDYVAESLGPTYPELYDKRVDAKRIIEHEENAYSRLRAGMGKKWKELVKQYPEVEALQEVELSGFVEGYKQFKEAMANHSTNSIPAELVFKLYDTHGFQMDIIERIASLNNVSIDKAGFNTLLQNQKSKHKAALKEQADTNKALQFNVAIKRLHKNNINSTDDQYKYQHNVDNIEVTFPPLKSRLVALLSENGEWIEHLEINDRNNYYVITEDTNFYCEEGGQAADRGEITFKDNVKFIVDSVFKIRDFVFHKGCFQTNSEVVRATLGDDVSLCVDSERRLNTMRNHTAIHLLNAAMKIVLPKTVTCQVGSTVNADGLVLNLAAYGEKLSQTVILEAQRLIRRIVASDLRVDTLLLDSSDLVRVPDVLTVPGETYPETGLRLVQVQSDQLSSRELCCGTHVPSTGHVGEFCITGVKGAGGHAPVIYALTGDRAAQVIRLTELVKKLQQNAVQMEGRELKEQSAWVRAQLARLCAGGAARGEHGRCLELLDALQRQADERDKMSLNSVAEIEMRNMALEAEALGRPFIVHFLMCSYLMESASLVTALTPCKHTPTMVFGCANGIIKVACQVPKELSSKQFTAESWLRCVLPIFQAKIASAKPGKSLENFAAMTGTKVSLINCETLVHDAMKVAIEFAKLHTRSKDNAPSKHYTMDKSAEDVGRG